MTRNTSGCAVLLAVFLAACSSGGEDTLVGRWETPGGRMALHFDDDGTYTADAPRGNTSGRYRLVEDGRVQMDADGNSTTVDYTVSDGKLTFCQPQYRCDEFQRVR